jgi:hypothetical protein
LYTIFSSKAKDLVKQRHEISYIEDTWLPTGEYNEKIIRGRSSKARTDGQFVVAVFSK